MSTPHGDSLSAMAKVTAKL